MTTQTKTAQKKIIAAAKQDGTLDELFWYITAKQRLTYYALAAPANHVPVVRVSPDPEESREVAMLLLSIVKDANPKLELFVELTTHELLNSVSWYEWEHTADWDLICCSCGGVRPKTQPTCFCGSHSFI